MQPLESSRGGLNKLRRVELDVLWIQEQQAHRLLPLRKVPGPRNPSDMMTNNVDQAHIGLYLDLLNLRFGTGRADIAQNLHSMGETLTKVEAKWIARSRSHGHLTLTDIDLVLCIRYSPVILVPLLPNLIVYILRIAGC